MGCRNGSLESSVLLGLYPGRIFFRFATNAVHILFVSRTSEHCRHSFNGHRHHHHNSSSSPVSAPASQRPFANKTIGLQLVVSSLGTRMDNSLFSFYFGPGTRKKKQRMKKKTLLQGPGGPILPSRPIRPWVDSSGTSIAEKAKKQAAQRQKKASACRVCVA